MVYVKCSVLSSTLPPGGHHDPPYVVRPAHVARTPSFPPGLLQCWPADATARVNPHSRRWGLTGTDHAERLGPVPGMIPTPYGGALFGPLDPNGYGLGQPRDGTGSPFQWGYPGGHAVDPVDLTIPSR